MRSARVFRRILVVMTALAVGICDPRAQIENQKPGPSPEQLQAVSNWLSNSAIKLGSLEAGHAFADLQPLKQILQDVRIVGLGEGTHGTREFFQFKHRLLEFLVKEMGYTLFVMEGGYGSSLAINDYVAGGAVDLSQALATFGAWTWDTQEVAAMIEWMRQYNKTVPEQKKVRFLGYDPDLGKICGECVTAFLKRVAPDHVSFAENAMQPLLSAPVQDIDFVAILPDSGRPPRSDQEKAGIREGIDRLVAYLESNRAGFIPRTSVSDFAKAIQCARSMAQFNEIFSLPWVNPSDPMNSGLALRDIYTADNAKRLLDQEVAGSRMVIWAHNGHIASGPIVPGVPSLGSYLRRAFGDAYYAVGFSFNEGSFQARNLDTDDSQFGAVIKFTLGPAPQGTVEWLLARPGLPSFFINLRPVPRAQAAVNWLNTPLNMRHTLGAGYSVKWPPSTYTRSIVLRQYYDGLVFVNKTSRARPNPSGVRPPLQRVVR